MIIEIDSKKKIQKYRGFLTLSLVLLAFILSGNSSAFSQDVNEEIQKALNQAVQLAREGNYKESLELLENLVKADPQNKKILYDYIVVLSWSGEHEKAYEFAKNIDLEKAPVYFLEALAKSTRHTGQIDDSISIYEHILKRVPGHFQAKIGIALCYLDKGHIDSGIFLLKEVEKEPLKDPELLFTLAHAYNMKKEFVTEMAYYQKILQIDPENKRAKKKLLLLISTLGAPSLALEMLEKEKELEIEPHFIERILGDYAAQWVRWGDLTPESEEERFLETDMAIERLEENIRKNKERGAEYREVVNRARFDLLVALHNQGKMGEVVKDYESLVQENIEIPPYALRCISNAFLYLSKPGKAAELYERALEKDPGNFEIEMPLFYAYLEGGKHKKAKKHIARLAEKQPVWFRVGESNVYGKNRKKFWADLVAVLSNAYSGNLKKAQNLLADKIQIAPFNRILQNELGKVYYWRGWPRRAIKQFDLVLATDPKNLDAKIWRTLSYLSLNRSKIADDEVKKLLDLYPEQKSVQKLKREWDTNHMSHYYSEINAGKGAGVVLGTKEFTINNYLYSPPLRHLVKVYAHYQHQWAEFFAESVIHRQLGLGFDFSRGDFGGNIEFTKNYFHNNRNDYGFLINGHWDINDRLKFSAGFDTNTIELPLKSRLAQAKGKSASADFAYRASDEINLSANFRIYDFNDGNVRRVYGLLSNVRLVSGPKLQISARGELSASTNSLDENRIYYNPRKELYYGVSADIRWTLFRSYDFRFLHRLDLTYGNYWQKNYQIKWAGALRYEHTWDFDDRKSLIYGISRSRQIYDGNPEFATIFYATISWRF